MSTETVFSKILRKEIPSVPVYEDEYVYAFLDANPVNPGHTLVVPKRACIGLLDCDPEILSPLILGVQRVARAVKAGTGAEGINIHQNEGSVAGQKVFYLHFHVIPRFTNDGREHWHGKPYASDDDAQTIAAEIRKHV